MFQKKDFRQQQLKPAQFKTEEELQQRQIQWQKVAFSPETFVETIVNRSRVQETLGKLGEAFEVAPKPDALKLMEVER